MKLYHTQSGILITHNEKDYLVKEEWHQFINDDRLYDKCTSICDSEMSIPNGAELLATQLLKPIDKQEIWASGVTYYNSKLGRQEESKDSGGGDFYEKVYGADRPELFFKSTAARAVGHQEQIAIRKDSSWDVPEPELTLYNTSNGKTVAYTIGNDVSSRSIEGENPLYLPQAKTYDRSAAIGPCLFVPVDVLPPDSIIGLEIFRNDHLEFQGSIGVNQIVRKLEDLVAYLYLETTFPYGSFLMTGTGIVPDTNFTLNKGDRVEITIDHIGKLINTVA